MTDDRKQISETDFAVIGSGIGGLCCAALLARYGYPVTVCESYFPASLATTGANSCMLMSFTVT